MGSGGRAWHHACAGAQRHRFARTTAPSRARLQEEGKACRSTRTEASGTAMQDAAPRPLGAVGRSVLTAPRRRDRAVGGRPGTVAEEEALRAHLELMHHGVLIVQRGAPPAGRPVLVRVDRLAARVHPPVPVTRARAGPPAALAMPEAAVAPVAMADPPRRRGAPHLMPPGLTGRRSPPSTGHVLRSFLRTSCHLTSIASPAAGCAP